jgi:hypothetical protein
LIGIPGRPELLRVFGLLASMMLAQCRHNLYRSPVDFVHEAEIVLVKSNESQVMDTFSRAQIDETTLPWLISSSSRMFKDWTIHSWRQRDASTGGGRRASTLKRGPRYLA